MEFREGTLEYDMATPRGGNFMGAAFHATTPENSEVVFFRPCQSGTAEAVQYAPALNGVAAAWQIYHGDGANAVATIPLETWVHVRLDVAGVTTRLYLNDDTAPVLVVPRLAGVAGTSVGVWTGFFGRGAYFSNLRVTARPPAPPETAPPPLPRGTIADWDLSPVHDADHADRAERRRLLFGYSDGIVVSLNGQPLFFGMNASRLRSPDLGQSAMDRVGSALYLPLQAGENELVFAVTEYTGGWAFWGRLGP